MWYPHLWRYQFYLHVHLNLLMCDRNIVRSSSVIFSNLQQSSIIFGKNYVWKSLEDVQKHSSGLWANFGKSSENEWMNDSLCIVNFYTIITKLHSHLDIQNLHSRVERYFTHLLCALLKHFSTLEDKFISMQPCKILYLLQCFHRYFMND